MEISSRNRSELKSYFVRNAIPTQDNFADLIDGMLNQQDDRIVKQSDGPLSLEAAGADETSQKPVLHFYRDFDANAPDWRLNLQPRTDATPEGSHPGLNIADGAGASRLFIDQNSGQIGLGTVQPTQELHIVAVGRNADVRLQRAGEEPTDLFSGSDRAGLWSYGNKALTLGTNNVERLRITDAGDVGIGTVTPNRSLTIFRQGAAYLNVRDGAHEILMGVDNGGGIVSVMTAHPLIFRSGGNVEYMRITPNGNVGIGVAAPAELLHLNGSMRGNQSGAVRISSGHGFLDVGAKNTSAAHFVTDRSVFYFNKEIRVDTGFVGSYNEHLHLRTSGTTRVTIRNNNGYVGILNTNPQAPLHLPGGPDVSLSRHGSLLLGAVTGANIAMDNNEIQARNNGRTANLNLQALGGNLNVNGKVVQGSDVRMKEQIEPLSHALERISALSGVSFKWRIGDRSHSLGLIAQEVEEVFPEVVEEGANGFKGISYTSLMAPVIEAIKEQQRQLETLRQDVERLTVAK